MIKNSPKAIKFYIKSAWARGKPTGEIIKKVYDKGVAAWRTGHRVGAGAEQWGYARVHSFLTLAHSAA